MSGGLALGYRKGKTGGTWIAKHYRAKHGRDYHALGHADDILDADGGNVFNFDQAQVKAREWLAIPDNVDSGPYTVSNAVDDYFRFLESDGRPAHTIRMPGTGMAHSFGLSLATKCSGVSRQNGCAAGVMILSGLLRACEQAKVSPKGTEPLAMMMRDGRGERRQIELGQCFVRHSIMRFVTARPLPI